MTTKVLIIDDDQAIRESMKQILQREDYEVFLAADGRAFLERFDPREIDLLLLDIDLPVRSGWEIFEEVTRRNPALPIIVITGHPGQFRVARAAGVGAFMEKPIEAVNLLQTMQAVLAEPEECRLRRLAGRGGRPRHVPASAEVIFGEFREWQTWPRQRIQTPLPSPPDDKGTFRHDKPKKGA